MRLKSLELFGFKSFVDRTVIHFEEGITAIVGPNGAGKSNCVDALRWAMGEQSAKHLRGSEMQDVIFSGTNTRPAVGMAQVILRFDLTDGKAPAGYADYSEIEVERRLYRSGESEYAINKVPCRLRDVIDLFLGTGVGTKAYSIVEQGKIEQILSSKPEQRRLIIEEAAGISKFKNRKETALRKIESTQANLARLKDVTGEIKRQLNSLDRQARRAERYKKLYEELKARELKASAFRFEILMGEKEDLEERRVAEERDEAGLNAKLSEVESTIETERLDLTAMEQDLGRLQEKFYLTQNAAKLHETTLTYQTSKIGDCTRQIETDVKEIEAAKKRLKEWETEIENLNESQVRADFQFEQAAEKIAALEKDLEAAAAVCKEWQEKTEQTNRAILDAVAKVSETQSHFEYLEKRDMELEGRIAKGQAETDGLDRKLKEFEKKIAHSEKDLSELKQLELKLQGASGSLREELEGKRRLWEQKQQELERLKEDWAAKNSRLQSLSEIRKNMEGYGEGVRHVLKASGEKLEGIRGAVGEMVEVEARYEPAVAAVLGEKLQYVVVRSQSEGVEAVEYLKSQAAGRSSFIPLDVQAFEPAQQKRPEGPGVLGPLVEKVRFSDDGRRIAQYLFGDCLLVEDLQKALNLWSGLETRQTLVTLSGEVLDPAGVLSGGDGGSGESLLGVKRKIDELTGETDAIHKAVSAVQKEVLDLREAVQGLEERLAGISRDHHGEEIRFAHLEKDSHHLRQEKARTLQDRDRLSIDIARLLDERRELEKEREAAILRLEEGLARQHDFEKQLRDFQTQLSSAVHRQSRLSEELLTEKNRQTQSKERAAHVGRELEKGVQAKLELRETLEKGVQNIESARRQIESLKINQVTEREMLGRALQEKEGLQEKQVALKNNYESKARAVQEKEALLREVRKQIQQRLQAKHENDLKLQETQNQLSVLTGQVWERYKTDLARHAAENPVEEAAADWEVESAAIAELREKLEKLGSVHVGALEEYDELKKRHDFLSRQEADLEKSLEDLKKAIQKINRVSRERFLATFDAVNVRFQEVFPRLFKGGRAKLLLVDEQNLLETGVEIFAQPPGKKLQSITLLSGGEKALTAVALIFSIFLIKPSPFCLLDEVDAPLDDANIDRFNDQVRTMTSQSQFIVITHNKRTMERSDCLYGVTMEEPGVSKIVSVRLNQEEALKVA